MVAPSGPLNTPMMVLVSSVGASSDFKPANSSRQASRASTSTPSTSHQAARARASKRL
ncbi:hypothetical protein D3C71_1874870 [compost metagenome]